MKTVYFVRHGESEANAGAPVFQDEESPLTKKGEEQADFIAERAARLSFDLLISSPAVRARETARRIAEKTSAAMEIVPFFTERKMPKELVGVSVDDADAVRKIREWERGFLEDGADSGSGENFYSLKERAGKCLAYLEQRPEERILVVAHGFLLRTLVARVTFGDTLSLNEYVKVLQTFRTVNTGLSLFEFEPSHGGSLLLPPPRWAIRAWNDHAHLG